MQIIAGGSIWRDLRIIVNLFQYWAFLISSPVLWDIFGDFQITKEKYLPGAYTVGCYFIIQIMRIMIYFV